MSAPLPPSDVGIPDLQDPARLRAARALGEPPGPEPAFERTARIGMRALGAAAARVVWVDDQVRVVLGTAGPQEAFEVLSRIPLAESSTAEVVARGATALPAVRAPAGAYLGVPIRVASGLTVGALEVLALPGRGWTSEDVQALEDVAASLVLPLEARAVAREVGAHIPGDTLPEAVPAALSEALRTDLAHTRALLDAMTAGVRLENDDGRPIHVNQALWALFPELSGSPATRPLRSQFLDPEAFEVRVAELLRERSSCLHELLPTADGRVLERDYLPIGVDGTARGHLWVYRDVTDRERAQSTLAEQKTELLNLSFVDELTGLYNRRGFLSHARPRLDEAVRAGERMLLIFVDLDGLKQINDRFGHQVGDRALAETASLLRSTFRDRDVVARLGGDEFVVLVTQAAHVTVEGLLGRLGRRAALFNGQGHRDYAIAFSTGVSFFDPADPEPLERLLAQADARMYEEKRRRKQDPGG